MMSITKKFVLSSLAILLLALGVIQASNANKPDGYVSETFSISQADIDKYGITAEDIAAHETWLSYNPPSVGIVFKNSLSFEDFFQFLRDTKLNNLLEYTLEPVDIEERKIRDGELVVCGGRDTLQLDILRCTEQSIEYYNSARVHAVSFLFDPGVNWLIIQKMGQETVTDWTSKYDGKLGVEPSEQEFLERAKNPQPGDIVYGDNGKVKFY